MVAERVAATVRHSERPTPAATSDRAAATSSSAVVVASSAAERSRGPAGIRGLHGDTVRAGPVEAGVRTGEGRDGARTGDGADVVRRAADATGRERRCGGLPRRFDRQAGVPRPDPDVL